MIDHLSTNAGDVRVPTDGTRASSPRREAHGRLSSESGSALPAAVSVWCVRAFVPAAMAGAVIALMAPIPFVRILGVAALAASLLAALLHIYLLRHDHPGAWNAWRVALGSHADRFRANVSNAFRSLRVAQRPLVSSPEI